MKYRTFYRFDYLFYAEKNISSVFVCSCLTSFINTCATTGSTYQQVHSSTTPCPTSCLCIWTRHFQKGDTRYHTWLGQMYRWIQWYHCLHFAEEGKLEPYHTHLNALSHAFLAQLVDKTKSCNLIKIHK